MLEPILDSVRASLPDLVGEIDMWWERAAAAPPVRPFDAALMGTGLSVIAEVKRRSPSAGDIALGLDPAALCADYERGGAAAISVLTEERHFGGTLGDLAAARDGCGLPLLRKDFILHPVQVAEARAAGADAVLLITAALDDSSLANLIAVTGGIGMVPLVEAHDGEEVARAAAAGATVIGINNRDLRTFEVDLGTAERLRALIPSGVVAVAESGIAGRADAARMAEAGYDAVLVGQAAATSADPASFVASLRGVE